MSTKNAAPHQTDGASEQDGWNEETDAHGTWRLRHESGSLIELQPTAGATLDRESVHYVVVHRDQADAEGRRLLQNAIHDKTIAQRRAREKAQEVSADER